MLPKTDWIPAVGQYNIEKQRSVKHLATFQKAAIKSTLIDYSKLKTPAATAYHLPGENKRGSYSFSLKMREFASMKPGDRMPAPG